MSSYVGISEALGINIAQQLLGLLEGHDIKAIPTKNQLVRLDLTSSL